MQKPEDAERVIIAQNVSKNFRLPHEKTTSIKGALFGILRAGRGSGYEMQRALRGVSFDVKKGDFFGIVGRNGSGKSTLLKLLAGIYTPTAGDIHVRGKLTPFIELGVGFNPELTGRENVFLNGALLGFSRKDMLAIYDDIVAFAELERFMDQKLKNYSSGMQVRLAFSIAIRAESDILLLDEVLAVGDEAFQQKCIDIFEKYKDEKQTVVLVTHDMGIVRRFCSRAILVDKGQIIAEGSPEMVAGKYSKMNEKTAEAAIENEPVEMEQSSNIQVQILDKTGKPAKGFNFNDILCARLSWPKNMKGVKNVGVSIVKNTGEYVYGVNTFGHHVKLKKHVIDFRVELKLGPGKYHLMLGLFGDSEQQTVEFVARGPQFIVRKTKADENRAGIARLDSEWKEHE